MSEIFFYLAIICFALLCLRRIVYGIFVIFDCVKNKCDDNPYFEFIEMLYSKSAWLIPFMFLFLALYVITK